MWSVIVEKSNTVDVTCKLLWLHSYLIFVLLQHLLPLVPAPTAVTITPPVGVIIAGSSPSLTCTVELSLAVDVPVTVNTVLSGPDVMFMPGNSVPAVMVNLTTYTSTVTVNAARNGSYSCQATVNSGGTISNSTDITVGMYMYLL